MRAALLAAALLCAAETPRWDPPPRPAPPPSAEEQFARARAFMKEKRWKLAEEALEGARVVMSDDDPRQVLYFERRAAIAYRNHERKKAKELYSEAIKIANALKVESLHAADAFEGMGRVLLDEGKPKYAVKFLERAFQLAPSKTTAELLERAKSRSRD